VVNGNLFFITPILYFILSIPVLLTHQALLVSLLEIINSIDGCGIVLNPTQLLSINTGVRESLGNVVVKDIKNTPLFRPKLLKKLKNLQWNYPEIGKLILTQLLLFKCIH